MGHRLARPELATDLEALVGAGTAGVEVLAEDLELLGHPAHPGPERDAPARQRRDRRGQLGHLDRVAQREHEDVVGEAQPFGDRGHGRHGHPRVGPRGGRWSTPGSPSACVRVGRAELGGIEEVVGDEHAGEAGVLAGHGPAPDRRSGPSTRWCARSRSPWCPALADPRPRDRGPDPTGWHGGPGTCNLTNRQKRRRPGRLDGRAHARRGHQGRDRDRRHRARRAASPTSGSATVASSPWARSTRTPPIVTDATGRIVMPGFVDPHTHYDAQLLWDPSATPSANHGVTTVIAGNCGFTLAPCGPTRPTPTTSSDDVPGRGHAPPRAAERRRLELGDLRASTSTGSTGNIAVNAGFLVGHCAIRRYVMGAGRPCGNEATPEQIDAMVAELRKAIEAGALGFSFTQSGTHSDGDGQPVPSRWATDEELLALVRRDRPPRGHHPRGHRRRLPRPLRRRRDRAARRPQRRGQPPAQLERAHRRHPRARPGAAPAVGLRQRQGRRAAGSSPSPCRCSSP